MMSFYQSQQIQLIDITPRKRQIELISVRRSNEQHKKKTSLNSARKSCIML